MITPQLSSSHNIWLDDYVIIWPDDEVMEYFFPENVTHSLGTSPLKGHNGICYEAMNTFAERKFWTYKMKIRTAVNLPSGSLII
jgi:hypothetical protein